MRGWESAAAFAFRMGGLVVRPQEEEEENATNIARKEGKEGEGGF